MGLEPQEWVVGEVLPSIRKTGRYESAPQPERAIPTNFADALRLAAELEEEKNAAVRLAAEKEAQRAAHQRKS